MSEDDAKTLTDSQYEVSLGQVGPGSIVFGRYKLVKELGRGGMGVVWLAQDERVDIPVALKFLPDVVARDAESVDELKRELRRGLNLTHPGIVRVYSFEQDESGAAIAMEYVDGPTLGGLKTKQSGSVFDCDDLLPWIEQLCAALDYAHFEAKIVHRDLKPRNLMLTSKGRLKIADFGVATSISETVSRVSIRKDGSGTPPYMSPQQAFGEDPSPGDDIYSLGATVYELITGRPPFYQGNILAQVQQRVPPPMADRRQVLKVTGKKPISPEWEATIAACLAKQPEDRPRRATEVIEALKGIRPAPMLDRTIAAPIDPAVTLESAGVAPLGHKAGISLGDAPTVGKGPVIPEEETTIRGRPGARRQGAGGGSRGLAAATVVLVLTIGGVAWWWSTQQDKTSKTDSEAVSATPAPEIREMPVATPLPLKMADAGRKPPESQAGDPAAKQLALADAQAMSEGKIPKPGTPWENSLGMKFVAIPGMEPLVSIYELRLEDYRSFAVETKRPWTPTEFIQGEGHPAVNMSWDDVQAFAKWLTEHERAAGKLGATQRYRLLTDEEWSRAVGLPVEEGATPEEKDTKLKGIYPWGTISPPPSDTDNLAGQGETSLPDNELRDYHDGFSHTAPVGRFKVNPFGLYDMGGNVAEWVEDWYDAGKTERTVRGSAYIYISRFDVNSSFRWHLKPNDLADYIGTRFAIDLGPAAHGETQAAEQQPR